MTRGTIASGSSGSIGEPKAVPQENLALNSKYVNTSSQYPAANQSIFTGSDSYSANPTQNHGAPKRISLLDLAACFDSYQSYGVDLLPPKDPYLKNPSKNGATQLNTYSMPSFMSKSDSSQSTRCSVTTAIWKFINTLEQHPDKIRSEMIYKMLREYDDKIYRSCQDAIRAQPNKKQSFIDHYKEISFLMLADLKSRLELPSTYSNEVVFFNGMMKDERFGDQKWHPQDSTYTIKDKESCNNLNTRKLREKETENSAASLMTVSPQGSSNNNLKVHPSSTQDADFKEHSPVDAKDKQADVTPNVLAKVDDTTKACIGVDPDIIRVLDELDANVIDVPKVNVIGGPKPNHNNSHTKEIKTIRGIISDPKANFNDATKVDDDVERADGNENNADANNNVPANTAMKVNDSLSVSNNVQGKFKVLSNDTQVNNAIQITNSIQPDATVLQSKAQPTNTATTTTKARRRNEPLPAAAVSAMALWYKQNEKYPYPSRDQMEQWAENHGLKFEQVKKWFANQRQRELFAQKNPEKSVRGRKLSPGNTEELARRGMENKRKRIRGASVDTKIKKHKSEGTFVQE